MAEPCTAQWLIENYPSGPPTIIRNLCLKAARKAGMATRSRSIGLRLPGQGVTRQSDINNAQRFKIHGGGSPGTRNRQGAFGDLGGTIGETVGGERGRQIGTIIGAGIDILEGRRQKPTTTAAPLVAPSGGAGGPCPEGRIRFGGQCIDLMALPPGGVPATIPAGGVPVEGMMGVPAMQPMVESRVTLRCARGMVLGIDNKCYPKAMLGPRSKWRKWKRAPKPPVSAADMKAIRRAARARERVADLGRDVGLHVSKTRPKSRKAIETELKAKMLPRGAPIIQATVLDD